MFDEMVSWYPPLKILIKLKSISLAEIVLGQFVKDVEARRGDVPSNVEQKSQLISGPQKSSISGSSSTPWKGRLRSSNIEHGSSQTSSRNHRVNDESSDSEKSVGEES
jgi:hypothetical protein